MPSTTPLDRPSDSATAAPVFCHLCGRALVRGRCSEHSRSSRRTGWALAVLAAVSITATGFGVRAMQNHRDVVGRLEAVDARLDDSTDEITRLEGSLVAASGATRVVGDRVADIEAKLNAVPDPTKVAAAVLASVATIVTPAGKGSAFVFSSDDSKSMLVTNFHVVQDIWDLAQRNVTVRFRERTYAGTIEQVSTDNDLALVGVREHLPALAVSPDEAKEGQSVTAVGSPLDFESTVTAGVVSAIRVYDGLQYLQISAAVNPGNSGGPVVDAFGRVVGVVVGKRFGAEGVGFAIPVARVCSALKVGCPSSAAK